MSSATLASQTVPNRSARCANCGTTYEPYWRRVAAQRFCSERCRLAAFKARQAAIDFAPPAEPLPPVVDQRVSIADRERLTGHNARVLELLREGPAPNTWLAAQFPPATAWRSRVSDCRKWLQARGETITREDCGGGLVWYWIEAL